MTDNELLRKHGWTLVCESPLEISGQESFATGQAARLVIDTLRQNDQSDQDNYDRATRLWFGGRHREAVGIFLTMDHGWAATAVLDILDAQGRAYALFFAEFLNCFDEPHAMQCVPEDIDPGSL